MSELHYTLFSGMHVSCFKLLVILRTLKVIQQLAIVSGEFLLLVAPSFFFICCPIVLKIGQCT